ncbi:MAG: hypothetical protein QXK17_01070 [Metallosphaera sp.]
MGDISCPYGQIRNLRKTITWFPKLHALLEVTYVTGQVLGLIARYVKMP